MSVHVLDIYTPLRQRTYGFDVRRVGVYIAAWRVFQSIADTVRLRSLMRFSNQTGMRGTTKTTTTLTGGGMGGGVNEKKIK